MILYYLQLLLIILSFHLAFWLFITQNITGIYIKHKFIDKYKQLYIIMPLTISLLICISLHFYNFIY
ncbi:hypothetical protein Catovirus_1_408 [Catovirus CTV1]|uniref:Uncharacterized protein n=1 Tax=Catovirus CTV1 TaxID=1977631 RepID=A0A1V0S9N1_9VIRU|nr:hypothetical protein Catovirus_1_408 [Catovirus CTV1]